ncbi:hypothetical protein MRX96_058178 [Rhipicephalus microplus]
MINARRAIVVEVHDSRHRCSVTKFIGKATPMSAIMSVRGVEASVGQFDDGGPRARGGPGCRRARRCSAANVDKLPHADTPLHLRHAVARGKEAGKGRP